MAKDFLVSFELDDKDIIKLKKSIRKLRTHFYKEMAQIIEATAIEVFDASAKELLKEEGHVASGELWRRIFSKNTVVTPDKIVTVFASTAIYSLWLEYGTRPHWVPFDQLREWAKIKFAIRDEAQLTAVTTAIHDIIRQRGTKAFPFMRITLEKNKRRFLKLIIRRMGTLLDKFNRGQI